MKMKAPNGSGTIYKMPGNRRKPWAVLVTGKYDVDMVEETTKQKRIWIGSFATKTEAREALALYHIKPIPPRASITLEQLYDEWADAKFQRIKKTTQDNYRAAFIHLSGIQGIKVRDLRTAQLQKIIDRTYLSRSSLEKIKALLVMLYNYAIQNDILDKNYAKYIDLPKTDKKEKERFTDIEIQKLKSCDSDPWVQVVLILIGTGLRISELLLLTRFNVDLKAGVLTGGLKTDAGKNRVIPIHPTVEKYLKSWLAKNGESLICKEDGKGISVNYFRRKFYYPALEKANVRKLTPHACRHTFASIMADSGLPTLTIQKVIGHADYSTTANIYSHPEVEQMKRAISGMKLF